jgi:catechol 2,3-dioxygenase-like lactoylglutathione lyase family enzyme
MASPLSGIDHVIIAVADLERARLAWERLGFTLTPRGRHLQKGTGNYCIMFERDYLELMGVVDPRQDTGGLAEFLADGEGPRGLAFATRAGDDTAAALARQGLHPTAPRDLTRQLELPEGTVLPRFKLVALPPEETPDLMSFVCQHLTPELVRRPDWLRHANAVVGFAGVVVLVEATKPLAAAYEKLFPAGVTLTDDVLTFHAGPHRLVFATADDLAALYPEIEPAVRRPLPAMVALRLLSHDLAATSDHLARWQVPYEESGDGTILVPPAEANGTLLIFSRA